MSEIHDKLEEKVQAIFREIVGEDRAKWLRATVPSRAMDQISQSVSSDYGPDVAGQIGFHIGDWQADAAFLVALHLFPERFTPEEVDEGVRSLLIHIPAHVIAAARLAGYPTDDFFRANTPNDR